jgi:hypothetical protein
MPLRVNTGGEGDDPVPLMPPIFQKALGFVYRNKKDAIADANFQAVGFFVKIPSTANKATGGYSYFVTNNHVVRDIGVSAFAIRVNTKTGVMTIPVKATDFVTNEKRDVAACAIDMGADGIEYGYVEASEMLQPWNDKQTEVWVGAGDDVVMPSRIVSKTKYKTRNTTVLRFGSVALAPENANDKAPFIVEMRSIAGHSGSPVFYYDMGIFIHGIRNKAPRRNTLIGINRGHLAQYEEVVSAIDIAAGSVGRKPPTHYVATNMAMSQVVPAWEILELLEADRFKKQRIRGDELLRARFVEDIKQ